MYIYIHIYGPCSVAHDLCIVSAIYTHDMVQSSSIAYHILLRSILNLVVYLSRVQGQDHTARWPVGELPS